jgi:hypothetical protein
VPSEGLLKRAWIQARLGFFDPPIGVAVKQFFGLQRAAEPKKFFIILFYLIDKG